MDGNSPAWKRHDEGIHGPREDLADDVGWAGGFHWPRTRGPDAER